jgi:hypothetical protein
MLTDELIDQINAGTAQKFDPRILVGQYVIVVDICGQSITKKRFACCLNQLAVIVRSDEDRTVYIKFQKPECSFGNKYWWVLSKEVRLLPSEQARILSL